MKNKLNKNFKGTIDQLLDHVTQAESCDVEGVCVKEEDIIKELMTNDNLSEEEATQLVEEAKLQMVKDTIDSLIQKDLVEVSEYDSNGEEMYSLTEKGKKIMKESLES